MRFLFCCEFYYPSVGGVQEVMRQIAERMVLRGHQVTVATTQLPDSVNVWNGVRIEHFAVGGNEARGVVGEAGRYRDFVINFPADAILIKAAQQWTFDALFPVLDRIRARKLFIPCGFSGLYEPLYKGYFERLPDSLRKFDRLIFYANHYRDIDFCRAHGLANLSFIPNGADENEFASREATPDFRRRLGIAEDSFVFSTVGNMTDVKGHREIAEAFALMDGGGKPMTLVLNGNKNSCSLVKPCFLDKLKSLRVLGFVRHFVTFLRREGFFCTARRVAGMFSRSVRKTHAALSLSDHLAALARRVHADPRADKQILVLDLPRGDVIDLFKTTDLFVFASNIEYSPLVLFESAAAGTPFLTVPVGNAEEIAAMTEAGIVCPAPKDVCGYTRVEPDILAAAMTQAMRDPALLAQLGQAGRRNWEQKFTWDKIASQYEALLTNEEPLLQVADKPPSVSILLPVFNGGAGLMRAVRSILGQTLQDFELLVIDDGSTDGAVAGIRALDDARIRVMGSAARRGLTARLNEGIDAARGAYIARMDADDIAFPERLRKQMHFLDTQADIDLVGCRAAAFADDGIIGLLPFAARHADICAQPWRGFPLPHPTWMGRATWFRRYRYATPEVSRAEDQELLLRSHSSSRFACLDEVLLGYRQGKFNLGRTLTARVHLLMSQQRYFLGHGQWKNAALSLAAGAAKIAVDLLAAVPGCSRLFFTRMSGKIPDQVVRDLNKAKADAGQG